MSRLPPTTDTTMAMVRVFEDRGRVVLPETLLTSVVSGDIEEVVEVDDCVLIAVKRELLDKILPVNDEAGIWLGSYEYTIESKRTNDVAPPILPFCNVNVWLPYGIELLV